MDAVTDLKAAMEKSREETPVAKGPPSAPAAGNNHSDLQTSCSLLHSSQALPGPPGFPDRPQFVTLQSGPVYPQQSS